MEVIKTILIISLSWLVLGTGIGFIIAVIVAEHGSIIFLVLGFWLGVIGAITNSIYLYFFQKHKNNLLLIAITASLITTSIISLSSFIEHKEVPNDIWPIFLITSAQTLIISYIVILIQKRLTSLTSSSSGTDNP